MKYRAKIPLINGEIKWLNNRPMPFEKLAGTKPILFHFWSISCTICDETLRGIAQLADQYRDQCHIISVHMPRTKEDQHLPSVERAVKNMAMHHPICVDSQLLVSKAFNNRFVPACYLFDSKAELRYYRAGTVSIRQLHDKLQRLLVKD